MTNTTPKLRHKYTFVIDPHTKSVIEFNALLMTNLSLRRGVESMTPFLEIDGQSYHAEKPIPLTTDRTKLIYRLSA